VQPTFLRLAPNRRHAILDAAFHAAAKQGLSELNINDVARAAGVPVGSLYQYFGSRNHLIQVVCALAAERLAAVFSIATKPLAALPLPVGLSEYLTRSIDWCEKEPTLMRIYASSAYNLAFGANECSSVSAKRVAREKGRSGSSQEAAASLVDQRLIQAISGTVQQLARCLLEAAHARGELRAGIDLETASRVVNVLAIAVIDAALLPGLNLYYRLLDAQHSRREMIAATVELICRGALA
jgi:AcrR family transcriptional regulator